MPVIGLAVITLFITLDLSSLQKQNPSVFREVFKLPLWVGLVYGLLMFLLYFQTGQEDLVFAFLLVIGFPVYLIKRQRYKKARGPLKTSDESIDIPAALASDAFDIVLIWFFGMLLVTLLIKGMNHLFPSFQSELGQMVAMAGLSFLLMLMLIYRTTQKYPDLRFSKVVGLQRQKQPLAKMVVLPAVIGLGFAFVSSVIIFARVHQPSTPLRAVLESTSSSWVILAFIGMAVLLAPFLEEIIFRGFFFHVISQVKGKRFAIYVIAIIFGFMHVEQYWGDWLAIGMVMMLGYVLTLFRASTNSSISSIVMHYTFNGAMTVIPVIMLLLSNPSYLEYQMNYFQLDSDQKEELLFKSIQESPERAEAYNDLAWLYAGDNRNLDEALRLIDKALTLAPEQTAFWDTKAEVLYKMGRVREAVAIEEDLVERNPSNTALKEQLEKYRSVFGIRDSGIDEPRSPIPERRKK